MTHHLLKTWPEYFWEVARGDKTFELRENDRCFQVDDVLHLAEYSPNAEAFLGPVITARVTYVLENAPQLGLVNGYCILGIKVYPNQPAADQASAQHN